MTSTSNEDDNDPDDDVNAVYDYVTPSTAAMTANQPITKAQRIIKQKLNFLEAFLETEMWGILVSVLMQDGPFAVMRIVSISVYRIVTYTNYFFAGKNVLVLCLQLYRLLSIYFESKDKRKQEKEQKRAVKLAKLYQGAFIEYQKRTNKEEKTKTDEDSLIAEDL